MLTVIFALDNEGVAKEVEVFVCVQALVGELQQRDDKEVEDYDRELRAR